MRAFTLIELLLVVIIIAILIGSVRFLFNDDLRRRTMAQTCVNEIYAMISQHVFAAVSAKDIYTDSTRHTPVSYTIDFNTNAADNVAYKTSPDTNATIAVNATVGNNTITIDAIQHNDVNTPTPFHCSNTDQYFVGIQQDKESDLIHTITIQQGLRATKETNAMIISGNQLGNLTGHVLFSYCTPNVGPVPGNGVPPECIPLSKMLIDTRTARITKVDCNARNPSDPTVCTQRADESASS